MIHRDACPACDSPNVAYVLEAEDHTVSHERFEVWECGRCSLRFTQGAPAEADIGAYYASEEYISHSNTSAGLVNSLYQQVRRITLAQKRALVREVTGRHVGSLLDVGCGTGEFAHAMQAAGWHVRGLEPDAGARAFAKTEYGLTVEAPTALPKLAGTFDAVTLWHVLEHVHELHAYLRRLRELIATGGTLLIAVPNYTSPDAKRYGADWAAYDVPRHLYHFSPVSIERLLAAHRIEVTETRAMPFDGFYVSMLSEKYASAGASNGVVGGVRRGLKTLAAGRRSPTRSSSVIYVCRGI